MLVMLFVIVLGCVAFCIRKAKKMIISKSRFDKKARNLILAVIAAFGVILPTLQTLIVKAQDNPSTPATQIEATVAQDWMQVLYKRIQAEGISAPAGSRLYGYAGVTLFQAVYQGIPFDNSLSGQLEGLGDVPELEPGKLYDWASTANGALSVVLHGLMDTNADTTKAFNDLRAKETAARTKVVDPETVKRSEDYGEQVGKILLDYANNDNFLTTRDQTFTLPKAKPEEWVPTTAGGKPVEPFWGTLRPYAMQSPDECNVKMNLQFSTDPKSTFYAQAMEVKTTRDHLTDEQKGIADFWIDSPSQTGTPAGHWVLIETQLIDQLSLKLDKAAEMYALVGMALADSFISCWNLKYQVLLLRPVTYINQYISRSWAPYVQTPMFPEYDSGHSVASQAAATVLTAMFGTVAFKDASHTIFGLPVRSYTSVQAAASEAAISRLYGGIHYRIAIENGLKQGQCVGQTVLSRLQLRPRPQGE